MHAPDLTDQPAIRQPPLDGATRLDISLLDEPRGAPPAFPLEIMPRIWGPWCDGAAYGASTPIDYVALALLGAAASLVGGARRVTPAPGWSEPCILWTALVGPPSSGKTPAIDSVLRLMHALEPETGRGGVPTPALPLTPGDPASSAPPRPLVIGDTAIEAVAGVLQAAPRGVLLARDEHGGWLAHMVRGTRDGRAHAFWLSAWAGRGCSVSQRGRAIALADPAVSILGTSQPEALEQALARDHDGMLARFLFVRPTRVVPQALPMTDLAASPEAVAALRRLRDMPAARRDLSLSPEALAAFEAFRQSHHPELDDLAGRAADWWGKGPGTVLRLAGVLTFLDWAAQPAGAAEPAQVPAWALCNAAGLWRDYLWPHAQATLRIAGAGGERERHIRKVLRWLATHRLPMVSRETLRRDALGQMVDAAATDRIIDVLVWGGWLQPAEPEPGARGRRRLRWHVCEALWVGTHPEQSPSVGPIYSSGALPGAEAEGNLDGWLQDRRAAAITGTAGVCPEASERVPPARARSEAPGEGLAPARAPAIPAVSATPGSAGVPPAFARSEAQSEGLVPTRAPAIPAVSATPFVAYGPVNGASVARPYVRYDDNPAWPRRGGRDDRPAGETAIPAVSAVARRATG